MTAHLIADDPRLPFGQQGVDAAAQLGHLGLVFSLVGVGEFDDVEPLQILAGHLLNELFDRVPDDVGTGQPQHPGVHRLHRQGVSLHHKGGVSERRREAVVLDVDERPVARNGGDVEASLGDEAQRPFRAAQHPAHIQGVGVGGIEVLEIVTGQEAVELGEGGLYVGAPLAADAIEGAVDLPLAALQRQLVCQALAVHRLGRHDVTVLQHGLEPQHVIRGLAVHQRPLPRGICVDHAAQGGAVGGGEIRREEVAVGFEVGVELILHHPGLGPHPALLQINFQDLVHMAREIDDNAAAQGLTIGAGTAAAREETQGRVLGPLGQLEHHRYVIRATRIEHRLRYDLIDAVIRRHRQPACIRLFDITTKC